MYSYFKNNLRIGFSDRENLCSGVDRDTVRFYLIVVI